MDQDILVFEIDDRQFGLPADVVVEVVRAVSPLPVPRTPDAIMGIINLRGKVVPVIDTRALLRMETVPVRHTDHLIIVRDGKLSCAIHADRAIDLLHRGEAEEAASEESPEPLAKIRNTSMGMVQILDPAELLGDAERSALETIASSRPPAGSRE